MSARKARLTVTVDPELIAAGNRAVAEGRAESLSGWVNQAIAERATKERYLAALAEAVAAYEEAHGEISEAEMLAQTRRDRAQARVVRGAKRRRGAA